ncbi:MAG: metallophosphoesterase [Verrucomicrobiaceae bacterium]|nr:MAG: metallophosphoesterase [Verrucomicrobiaceae bacterium]
MKRTDTAPSPSLLSRRNALKLIGGGVAACVADAVWLEPGMLTVTRRDIPCTHLPPGLSGLKICFLSDFHFTPGADNGLLEKTIIAVGHENPDIIALGGDYVADSDAVMNPLLEALGKLNARHGIFAVMGNHDGWAGNAEVIRTRFERAGISFLINRNTQLSIRGERLAVAGTDFVWLGKPDPARTLRGIAASTPVLALVHEPDYFDRMIHQREILLQLSGHTHGGQCRVPFLGCAPAKVEFGKNYVYGDYRRGDSHLFVTRGLGMTGLRVRFACPPEVAVLTLRSPVSA